MNNYTRAFAKVGVLNFANSDKRPSGAVALDAELEAYRKEQQMRFDGRRPDVMEVYEGINRGDFTVATQYRAIFGKDATQK